MNCCFRNKISLVLHIPLLLGKPLYQRNLLDDEDIKPAQDQEEKRNSTEFISVYVHKWWVIKLKQKEVPFYYLMIIIIHLTKTKQVLF